MHSNVKIITLVGNFGEILYLEIFANWIKITVSVSYTWYHLNLAMEIVMNTTKLKKKLKISILDLQ